jgi:hypothetical protein
LRRAGSRRHRSAATRRANSRGVKSPKLLCGRSTLYSSFHAAICLRASNKFGLTCPLAPRTGSYDQNRRREERLRAWPRGGRGEEVGVKRKSVGRTRWWSVSGDRTVQAGGTQGCGFSQANSSLCRRVHFPQPSGAHCRPCHSKPAPFWNLWRSWRDWFFLFRFTCSHVSADTAAIFAVQQAALFLPLIFSGTASG